MNLRGKTLLGIGGGTVCLFVILVITSETIIMRGFTNLEEQNVCQDMERFEKTLSNELANLNNTAHDWSAWDDTYAFVEDGNTAYIESNLMGETLFNVRLNVMVFVNASGDIVFKKAVDLQEEVEVPFPHSLEEHLSPGSPLLQHTEESSITGLILLPEGPLLLASRPILTSFNGGPIHGTLLMGRYLNASEIERLEEMTQVSITIYHTDEKMPADFETALTSFKDTVVVQPLNDEYVAGYTPITDLYGNPILVVRVDTPRDIYNQGKKSANYLLLALVIIGLVFGTMALFPIEEHILSRLTRMGTAISRITASGDLSQRIPVEGKDELSQLEAGINHMINAAERSTQNLEESKKELERTNAALQESLKEKEMLLREVHHRVKNNMQVISSLLALQTSYIKDRKVQEAFRDSQHRVKSMALVHEKLYRDESLEKVNVATYLHSLTQELFSSYGVQERVALELEVEDFSLNVDAAIPLGLIINELVSNALKHAFPEGKKGEIRVRFRPLGEDVELVVSDNGVGIPESIDFRRTDSLGLHLVTILVEDQLGGTIALNREGGTTFTIVFNPEQNRRSGL